MAETHVVSALMQKRADIAGQIEHTQTALRQLIIDLDNLDATLRLFEPDIDLEVIRPKPFPPRNAAVRGNLSRIVFASLRQSSKPLTAQDIAQHVMAERGLNTSDTQLVKLIGKRVGACLRHQRDKGLAVFVSVWAGRLSRDKGLVRSEVGKGQCLGWEVVKSNVHY